MAIPAPANAWSSAFDPSDYKEYVADWSDTLESGETITSFTAAVSAEASAVGLSIDTATNPPAKVNSDTGIRLWFEVSPGEQGNAAFDNAGTIFAVTVSVVTSQGREYQKTWTLTVQQQ